MVLSSNTLFINIDADTDIKYPESELSVVHIFVNLLLSTKTFVNFIHAPILVFVFKHQPSITLFVNFEPLHIMILPTVLSS